MNSGLYAIENTRTGDVYVGSTIMLNKRFRFHRYYLATNRHPNARLQRAWNRDGEDAFRYVVLVRVAPGQVREMEQRLLDQVVGRPDCYNISRNAKAPMDGRRQTPEANAKVSARFKGRPKSLEHRAKIAAALRGKVRSAEHSAKIGTANRGKKASQETRALLSRQRTGRPCPMKGKKHRLESRDRISQSLKAFHANRAGVV